MFSIFGRKDNKIYNMGINTNKASIIVNNSTQTQITLRSFLKGLITKYPELNLHHGIVVESKSEFYLKLYRDNSIMVELWIDDLDGTLRVQFHFEVSDNLVLNDLFSFLNLSYSGYSTKLEVNSDCNYRFILSNVLGKPKRVVNLKPNMFYSHFKLGTYTESL